MVNEVLQAQEYLDGKNIDKNCLFKICFTIAKWYKEQGLNHMEIRDKIFEWGKQNDIYIDCNVNNLVSKAIEDQKPLRGDDVVVHISDNDINEIKRRFDSKMTRRTALAILCYAKVTANNKGEFSISLLSLGQWLGKNSKHLGRRYITELIDFEYIKKCDNTKTYYWDKINKAVSKSLKLQMLVPVKNKGKYVLEGNNIDKLYDDIFENEKL